jgi:hypothetical protein
MVLLSGDVSVTAAFRTYWTWEEQHYRKSCDHSTTAFNLSAVQQAINCADANDREFRGLHCPIKKYSGVDSHPVEVFQFSMMFIKVMVSYILSPVEVFPLGWDGTRQSLKAYLDEPMEIGFRDWRAPYSNRAQTLMFLAQVVMFFAEIALFVCVQRPHIFDIWSASGEQQFTWLVLTYRVHLLWPSMLILTRGALIASKFKQTYGTFVNVNHPTLVALLLALPIAKLGFYALALAWGSNPAVALYSAYQFRESRCISSLYVIASLALMVPPLLFAHKPDVMAITLLCNVLFGLIAIGHRLWRFSGLFAVSFVASFVVLTACTLNRQPSRTAIMQVMLCIILISLIGLASLCSPSFRAAVTGGGVESMPYSLFCLIFLLFILWPIAISRATKMSFAPIELCTFEKYTIGVDIADFRNTMDNDYFFIWALLASFMVLASSFAFFRSIVPFVDIDFLMKLRVMQHRSKRSVFITEMVSLAYGLNRDSALAISEDFVFDPEASRDTFDSFPTTEERPHFPGSGRSNNSKDSSFTNKSKDTSFSTFTEHKKTKKPVHALDSRLAPSNW